MAKKVFLICIIFGLNLGLNAQKIITNKFKTSDTLIIKTEITEQKEILQLSRKENEEKINNQRGKYCSNKKEKTKNNFIKYLTDKWIELTSLLIAFLAILIPLYRFISIKRDEQKEKRFNTYHQLIRELVQPDESGVTKLDRQLAVIFELRHFPGYFEVTVRILKGLIKTWESSPLIDRYTIEITATLNYIEDFKWWQFWKK